MQRLAHCFRIPPELPVIILARLLGWQDWEKYFLKPMQFLKMKSGWKERTKLLHSFYMQENFPTAGSITGWMEVTVDHNLAL